MQALREVGADAHHIKAVEDRVEDLRVRFVEKIAECQIRIMTLTQGPVALLVPLAALMAD